MAWEPNAFCRVVNENRFNISAQQFTIGIVVGWYQRRQIGWCQLVKADIGTSYSLQKCDILQKPRAVLRMKDLILNHVPWRRNVMTPTAMYHTTKKKDALLNDLSCLWIIAKLNKILSHLKALRKYFYLPPIW